MLKLFVLLLLLVNLKTGFSDLNLSQEACPPICSCLGNIIDCSKQNLNKLFHFPSWAENLELSSNQLGDNVFDDEIFNLVELEQLKLSHNKLRTIPTLRGLSNLNRLHLSNNDIEVLSMSALEVLTNLKFLDLAKNNIKEIQTNSFPIRNSIQNLNLNFNKISLLTKGTFHHLKSLKKLDLSNNNLVEIQSLTFQNLNQLKILKLNNNKIVNLMDGAFHGLTTILTLELNNNSITNIRKGGLFNLTSLTNLALSENLISEIEQDGWEFCPRLENLYLSYNKLSSIDKYTFDGLSIMQYLHLDHNNISSIGEGTFNCTPNLEVLYLNDNKISWTIEDMRGPFMSLTKLDNLNLNSNQIKSISRNAFLGLKSLTLLELSQNNISSIQNNAFKDAVLLKNLIMNSTNLICDCNLLWFYNWIKEREDMNKIEAECSYPTWLRHKFIRDLHSTNFSCYDSPKPHIIDEPKSQLGIKGTNVSLICTATSTSADKMSFNWKRDNQEVSESMYKIKQINNDNGTIGTTELSFINIKQDAAGKYQCIITNNYGVVYSQKLKFTVGTYPKFKKTPIDVSVHSGKIARLDCAATGEPRPQIAWEKDGGNDFPAARERRMHVMPADDAFFIINAKLSDMGVYSCTAENPAGVIRANASLIVYESPSFVKPMENRDIVLGTSSVLECMASGSPRPLLQWMKDGEPIQITERHFFAAEGQLLIIVDTNLSDGGVYECRIENEFGKESGSMKLSVVPNINANNVQLMSSTGTGNISNNVVNVDDVMGIVLITVVCCAVSTSLIWVVIIYKTRKQNQTLTNANNSGIDGGDIDMNGGIEINQQNLIIRSGAGVSTTPASYFEYLMPMVRREMTTNVDLNPEATVNNLSLYNVVASPRQKMLAKLETDELEDDMSSKDSGTGGDSSVSATGSTNVHRESNDDLNRLLNRQISDVDVAYHYEDNDDDIGINPTSKTSVIKLNDQNVPLLSVQPKIVFCNNSQVEATPASNRLTNSHTFPTFGPSSSENKIIINQQLQNQNKKIQENKLNRLLLQNPRIIDKPAKYKLQTQHCEDSSFSQVQSK